MALTRRTQTARKMLVVMNITVPEAAAFVGCSYEHLANAVKGRARPNADVRARLPILLGLPIQALFESENLEGEYTGARRRGVKK